MNSIACKKELVIIGDSAFAEIAYEYFSHDSEYKVAAFSVESKFKTKESLFGLPIIDYEELILKYPPSNYDAFIAVTYLQMNKVREKFFKDLKSKGYFLASYVSSKAFVWKNCSIGENCFIFEDNTIQPFVTIGDNNILWSGNHIGHHSMIENNCFISSHVVICGFCNIGRNSFLGVNSTISNNVTLGAFNWIGPDVTIMKDTAIKSFWQPNKIHAQQVSSFDVFKLND